MALMFQRLARNFARNGYFPTDAETTARILSALAPVPKGTLRILDPCCGEGVALAECRQALGAARTRAFGIEYDEERAWHAKGLLDGCIHGDAQDCIVGGRQFGLIWLNPPYGDLVGDQAATAERKGGRQRLEKLFFRRALGWLQPGGVLVLIVPDHCLDAELARWISGRFDRISVFRAPEQRFRQVVVFGVLRRDGGNTNGANAAGLPTGIVTNARQPEELPVTWDSEPYVVPAHPPGALVFASARLDARQLNAEIARFPCLWEQFDLRFGGNASAHRPPLRTLSRWHLALVLAAGQVAGVVKSRDGRTFVIKGDTHKDKETRVEYETLADGQVREIRIMTDRFVPVIRALDFTPQSPTFGQVVEIR